MWFIITILIRADNLWWCPLPVRVIQLWQAGFCGRLSPGVSGINNYRSCGSGSPSSSLCHLSFSVPLFPSSFSGPSVDLKSHDEIWPCLQLLHCDLFCIHRALCIYITPAWQFLLIDCKLDLLLKKSVLHTIFRSWLTSCMSAWCDSLLKFTIQVTPFLRSWHIVGDIYVKCWHVILFCWVVSCCIVLVVVIRCTGRYK